MTCDHYLTISFGPSSKVNPCQPYMLNEEGTIKRDFSILDSIEILIDYQRKKEFSFEIL